MINVADYGASPSVSPEENRVAFQAALVAGAGQIVYVPNGTYVLADVANHYRCLSGVAGATLRGESREGVIVKQAPGVGPSAQLLWVEVPDFSIENLTFDGDKANQNIDPHRAGVFAKSAPRLRLSGVTSKNFSGDGFEVYNGSDDLLVSDVLASDNTRNGFTLGGGTSRSTVVSSQFLRNGAEQFDSEGGPVHDVTLRGCLFDAEGVSQDYVLTMTGMGVSRMSHGWTVTDCVCNGGVLMVWIDDVVFARNTGLNPTTLPAVRVYRTCDRIRILDNKIETTARCRLDAGAMVFITGTLGDPPGSILVSNNKFTTSQPCHGVTGIEVNDLRVVDNELIGAGISTKYESGVYVRTTHGDIHSVIIQRNRIANFGSNGILLQGNGPNDRILQADISNNEFVDEHMPPTMTRGLVLNDGTNAVRDVAQYGNTFTGVTTPIDKLPAGVAQPWGDGTRWVMP